MLPPLYERWAAEFLGGVVPAERIADCGNCVMLAGRSDPATGEGHFFDPVTRCCTYLPELPNYLVGRILADTSPALAAGRRSVELRVGRGAAVTPLGLGKTDAYTLLYLHRGDGFGRSRFFRCPHHLDDGSCGIWPHRMSVCATWFCKHSRGAVGLRFWRALLAVLLEVEHDLARWCLLELRLDSRALESLLPPPTPARPGPVLDGYQIDGRADPERYAAVWRDRAGGERELYEQCGELVAGLAWKDVLGICGPGVRIAARQAQDAFEALRGDETPRRLRVGELHIHRVTRTDTVVASYSDLDPLRLPNRLLEALSYFDGRPVADALRAIERERGLRIDPELLGRLVDFRILLPAPPTSPESASRATRPRPARAGGAPRAVRAPGARR